MTIDEFGRTIKAKYPQYNDMSDADLGARMLSKYPQYKDMVTNVTQTEAPPQEDGMLSSAGKLLWNLPGSAVNFGKGIVDTLNPVSTIGKVLEAGKGLAEASSEFGPVETAKKLATNLPGATLETLVPQGVRSGVETLWRTAMNPADPKADEARKQALDSLVSDPVGNIAPLLLTARGIAEKAGKGAQFDAAMSKISSPIEKAVTAPFNAAGRVGETTLGVTTGKGSENIRQTFQAGEEGGAGQQAYRGTLTGKTSPEAIVEHSKGAIGDIWDAREKQYQQGLKNVKTATAEQFKRQTAKFDAKGNIIPSSIVEHPDTTFVIRPDGKEVRLTTKGIKTVATNALKEIGVDAKGGTIDFSSRPSLDANAIQKVHNTIYSWKDTSPLGLNKLAQEVRGFRKGGINLSPADARFNHYIDSLSKNIKDYLGERVPEIKAMNDAYAKSTQSLKEITDAFESKNYDTAINKLTRALKTDNQFKLELLQRVKEQTGVDLAKEIAGYNMRPLAPGGIIGRGIDVYTLYRGLSSLFDPTVFAEVVSTVPRAVGEIVNALGVAKRVSKKVLNPINQSPKILIKSLVPSKKQ